MTESHDKLQEKLHLLTQSYAEELPIKISKIVQTWNQIQRKWNTQSLQALHRMVRNLVGFGKYMVTRQLARSRASSKYS